MPILLIIAGIAVIGYILDAGDASAKPLPQPRGPQPQPANDEVVFIQYEVKRGDTLGGIAARFLGAEALWPLIWDANRSRIGSTPDRLREGTTLTFPESAYDQAAVDLAIERAAAHKLAWARWSGTRTPASGPLLDPFILTGQRGVA